jgi:hypothetical protein
MFDLVVVSSSIVVLGTQASEREREGVGGRGTTCHTGEEGERENGVAERRREREEGRVREREGGEERERACVTRCTYSVIYF